MTAETASPDFHLADAPAIQVGVLGQLRLLAHGGHVPVASGSKSEALLVRLAMARRRPASRAELVDWVWPEVEVGLAGQSLNSLTHHLNKIVAGTGSGMLITHQGGYYRLADDGRLAVDIDLFDGWRQVGLRALRGHDPASGLPWCDRAIALYRGDLCYGERLEALNERERLRIALLDMLAAVADHHHRTDPELALSYLDRLLELDFLREDAQRLAMCCHVRLGHRSHALRQYRILSEALAAEFGAEPERDTMALCELIRHDPSALQRSLSDR